METIPLIKEDPTTARIVEHMLYGKTLEERDNERVLKASKLGLSIDELAELFELKTEEVRRIIAAAKNDPSASTDQNQH